MSEGYLIVDNRAVDGPPSARTVFESATKSCKHCGGVTVLNPERMRARATCFKCGNGYICDGCAAATKQAQYVHRSFVEVADMVRSGRFAISGDLSAPILVPTSSKEI